MPSTTIIYIRVVMHLLLKILSMIQRESLAWHLSKDHVSVMACVEVPVWLEEHIGGR